MAGVELTLVDGLGEDPLRGEQPNPAIYSIPRKKPSRGARARHLQAVTTATPPADLLAALAPVESVWQLFDRPYLRDKAVEAVRTELQRLSLWSGKALATELLADRLRDRLDQQGGSALVTNPLGWLLRRGLPQRQVCGSEACDDGIDLVRGSHCTSCDGRLADRRSTRRSVIAQVVAATPDATFEQRQSAIDAALARHAAERAAVRTEALRRAREDEARRAAQRAEREVRAVEAEAFRVAVACVDCGAARAAGRCRACERDREIGSVTAECAALLVAGWADLADADDVQRVREQALREGAQARAEARTGVVDGLDGAAEIAELVAVEVLRDEYRASAVWALGKSAAARAEAVAAFDAVMRTVHLHGGPVAAREKATADSEAARERAARWLLQQHLANAGALLAPVEREQPVVEDRDVAGAGLVRAAVNQRMAEELRLALGAAVREYVDLAVASRADLSAYASVRTQWAQALEELRQARADARSGADGVGAVQAELSAVRQMIGQCRDEALVWFEASERARSEARSVFESVLRLRGGEGESAARVRARREANATCRRIAEEDLARRVAVVERNRERTARATGTQN